MRILSPTKSASLVEKLVKLDSQRPKLERRAC
jgi:hypothetical protein